MVNIVLWGLAGGVAGWIAFSVIGFNEKQGLLASVIIGMVGGFVGGNILAPMFGAGAVSAGEFNPFSLFVAFASATAILTISNMVHKRLGF
jgi:uncharacterized membrane protein YeaQ/YmgE (transglycosylase-associated protein family)